MSTTLLTGLAAACLLSACAVGPDYERPAVPSAAAFPEGKGGSAAIAPEWWLGLGDARLNELVQLARKNNADVRVAVGRGEEASAGLADVAGAQVPAVTAGGGATRTVVSTDSYTSSRALVAPVMISRLDSPRPSNSISGASSAGPVRPPGLSY